MSYGSCGELTVATLGAVVVVAVVVVEAVAAGVRATVVVVVVTGAGVGVVTAAVVVVVGGAGTPLRFRPSRGAWVVSRLAIRTTEYGVGLTSSNEVTAVL